MPSPIGPWFDVRSFAPGVQLRDGSVDWHPYIQDAIDHIVALGITADSGTLYLPPGIYKISQPLQVRAFYQNAYTFCSIHIVGDAPTFGRAFHSSVIEPDYSDKPALIIQGGRAVKIENVAFHGKNQWISLPGRSPNDMETHHRDDDANYVVDSSIRDNRNSPYAGIHIDPYNSAVAPSDLYPGLERGYVNDGPGGGSSDIQIENCEIQGFVVGIGISLNGITQNAENITIVDTGIVSVKSAIAVGQDQSRTVTARNVNVYGAKIAFDCTSYGKGTGDCPSIFGANVKGVKYIFHTFSFGGNVSVSGLYSESIYSIGVLGGGSVSRDGHAFSGCSFGFETSPERKGAIVHRLANLTNTTFNACTFRLGGTEPIWIYNFYSLAFNQCNFTTNTPDIAPKLWINGNRERVSFNGTTVAMTPHTTLAVYTGLLAVDYMRALSDVPMLPGTLFYSVGDDPPPPSLRWVPGQFPLLDLGKLVVTVPQPEDGTATFTVLAEAEGRVAPGDFIYALKPVNPIEYPYHQVSTYFVIGKVSSVSGKEITLAHVPKIITASETLRLYATYVPRVHLPNQGTMDFTVSSTEITGMSNLDHWKQYERIRDKPAQGQRHIVEGTYITNDPATDGLVKLSRPAQGSGTVTLDLYDAEVWALSMTPV